MKEYTVNEKNKKHTHINKWAHINMENAQENNFVSHDSAVHSTYSVRFS